MTLILSWLTSWAVITLGGGPHCTEQNEGLIAHEWGTFTSFSGSDGVLLSYRSLLENDLPSFVYNPEKQTNDPNMTKQWMGKTRILSRQRMETPVIYFYTDETRDVKVKVRFRDGAFTDFFPPVNLVDNVGSFREVAPINLDVPPDLAAHSTLDWGTVRVFSSHDSAGLHSKLPVVLGGNHYERARDTDSSMIRFCDEVVGDFYEKFLFYRGVGNFENPLMLKSLGNDLFLLKNFYELPIYGIFLVEIQNGVVRFAQYDRIEKELTMELPKFSSSAEFLSRAMVDALVREGLFEKEADSMVRTWKESWFQEDGVRVFYVVPRGITDKLLPLEIEPKPDQLVRILVGRLEIATPETERQIVKLIDALGSEGEEAQKLAASVLEKMGRFAEPVLQKVLSEIEDEEKLKKGKDLLQRIQRRNDKDPALGDC